MRLREDDRVRTVGHLVGQFLVAMRGQAVHDDHILLRFADQFGIDLVRREDLLAFGGLLLLPHRGPGVGVDDVGVFHRRVRVAQEREFGTRLRGNLFGNVHRFRVQVVALGAGEGEVPAQFGGYVHQRDNHVVAVAHESDVESLGVPEFLDNGQRVRHALAGMVVIAQSIDHGNARPFGEFQHVGMLENARHQRLDVARKHARHVRDGLALAESDLAWGEVERVPAAMTHGHVKRDARPQAGFLEDHTQRLALENRLAAFFEIFLFKFQRQVEKILYLGGGIIGNREKVFHKAGSLEMVTVSTVITRRVFACPDAITGSRRSNLRVSRGDCFASFDFAPLRSPFGDFAGRSQ